MVGSANNHSSLVRLEMQPAFPHEDLGADNTEVLKYSLPRSAGVDAYTKELQHSQRYIHLLANRALAFLGVKTRYDENELYSFSHGFASLETISDLVHPPRIYGDKLARNQVAQFFVDTRGLFEIELEEITASVKENRQFEPVSHDRPDVEIEIANRQVAFPQKLPNTYDVIVSIGEAHNESMAQLQTRVAGAQLAYTLQSRG